MTLETSMFDQGLPEPCPHCFNAAEYCLSASANSSPSKTALIVVSDPESLEPAERWTFRQLDDAVRRMAAGLKLAGLDPGDRVMLRLGNTSAFPLIFFATIAAGGIAVPTSSQLSAREAHFILEDSGAKFVCTSQNLKIDGVPDGTHQLLDEDIRDLMSCEDITPYAHTHADDPAYIVYTSGATSRPKGVLHAHRAVWARRMMYDGWYGLGPKDRMLHAGAFNWTYTLGAGLMDPWAVGAGTVIYNGPKDPSVWPRLAGKHDATLFAAVPSLYRQMLKHAHHISEGFANLRHGLTAGEKLSEVVREQWKLATGKPLYEALGMSECSTYASSSPSVPVKPGFCGKPQRGRRVAILDMDDNAATTVPVGECGRLVLHKDDTGLMLRYWNLEAETQSAFRGDWFLTGDLAALDTDGYLQYLGRADDLMNAQGYRVSPQDIEDVLSHHPAVQECACAEVRVREDLSLIGAFIVLKPGTQANAEMLKGFARDRLASYKVPKEYVIVDSLPHTATGKVLRRELSPLYERLKQA
ncbi:AMP-binding protein [Magnetovibrio sp. PR-2]|uniref:acyl-CoA synthetase n=1 Tax=Magnetovibrio sp. PR-2 TaxID=3120356 RepID=UPI002FCDFEB5